MKSKTGLVASVSLATLGMLFGASAATAGTMVPAVHDTVAFDSMLVAANNNNNNNNNNDAIVAAAKPAQLSELSALA